MIKDLTLNISKLSNQIVRKQFNLKQDEQKISTNPSLKQKHIEPSK